MRIQLGGTKYAKAKYDRKSLHIPQDERLERIAAGESHVLRMKIPDSGHIEFKDMIHGKVRF
jgi:glutamyl-tRNA synthetase